MRSACRMAGHRSQAGAPRSDRRSKRTCRGALLSRAFKYRRPSACRVARAIGHNRCEASAEASEHLRREPANVNPYLGRAGSRSLGIRDSCGSFRRNLDLLGWYWGHTGRRLAHVAPCGT
jgi:hypothetical protein